MNFSSGIFVAYLNELGATSLIISLGTAALYVTRGTSSILIDKLAHKIPFKKLFIIAFLGSAVSTYFFVIPHNPISVALLRTVQGIFSGLYWVLINIYSIGLGKSSFEKFKNLSSVTIFLNIGGFIGCILTGFIAAKYSVYTSFYIGIIILLIGTFLSLFLPDIEDGDKPGHSDDHSPIFGRERLVLTTAILTSIINNYVNIGIPLFILQLGGSYKEIGITGGFGIMAIAVIVGFSPWLRKKFSYRTIMKVDYTLIIFSLFSVFYFKNINLIYFLQAILMGVCGLERNLWYAILHDNSKHYNKSIGLLRGFMDYFGAFLLLFYGYSIGKFGSIPVAISVGVLAVGIITFILKYRGLEFLKYKKNILIKHVAPFESILKRN